MSKRRGKVEKDGLLYGVDNKTKDTDENPKRRKVITRSVDTQQSSSQTKPNKQQKTVTLSDKTKKKGSFSKSS